jgi:mRNA-degrading endonuclease toxin of MazEF toxin-antitoxin module
LRRGEVWLAHVGRKRRPVLVLTRSEVIDVRRLVTVAEITTNIRGLAVEVGLAGQSVGLDQPSVVNCDGIHTIEQTSLTGPIGEVEKDAMREVCSAINYALGC